MPEDEITLDQMIESTNKLATFATRVPPCRYEQESSCIRKESARELSLQEKKKGWVVRPFSGFNFQNMCNACAAYWFLSMAEIELRHVKKMANIR